MKRVLIISYYWPPTGGSGVQRWVKFCKYLPSKGWQPVVYTPENPEAIVTDESLLSEIPSEVEVLKTHIIEPYNIYRKLTGAKKGGQEINMINSKGLSLKKRISLFIRGNFFIPDPRAGWVRPSVRYLKKYLREHPVDVIVTTGPPHSMHIIGRNLHRATGIPWVADFRDPWTRMYYFKHLGLSRFAEKLHLRLEKSVLDEASCVVAVTPAVQRDFRSMGKARVEMITNGFDTPDFEQVLEPRSFDFFTITHTGLFAQDGNPEALWKVLSAKCGSDPAFAKALRIRLAGKVDAAVVASIKAEGLESNLELLGYLPHANTVLEQRSADVLILPLRDDPEYAKAYPGKIFEYIAARRPVLGIGQSDGMSAALLSSTSSGKMCDWTDSESMSAFIDEAWERFKAGNREALQSSIDNYSREALSASMAALFDSLIK